MLSANDRVGSESLSSSSVHFWIASSDCHKPVLEHPASTFPASLIAALLSSPSPSSTNVPVLRSFSPHWHSSSSSRCPAGPIHAKGKPVYLVIPKMRAALLANEKAHALFTRLAAASYATKAEKLRALADCPTGVAPIQWTVKGLGFMQLPDSSSRRPSGIADRGPGDDDVGYTIHR